MNLTTGPNCASCAASGIDVEVKRRAGEMTTAMQPLRVRAKICGITSTKDAQAAVSAGADALGLVFYAGSKRCVRAEQAKQICAAIPPFVTRVGLFVNAEPKYIEQVMSYCGLDIAQLHGDETPVNCRIPGVRVIKALRLRDSVDLSECRAYRTAGVEAFLVDAWVQNAYGGTGVCAAWELAAQLAREQCVILAGGLNPDNVGVAIQQVSPYAVDVSSGVERSAGVKDVQKMHAFIGAVQHAHLSI